MESYEKFKSLLAWKFKYGNSGGPVTDKFIAAYAQVLLPFLEKAKQLYGNDITLSALVGYAFETFGPARVVSTINSTNQNIPALRNALLAYNNFYIPGFDETGSPKMPQLVDPSDPLNQPKRNYTPLFVLAGIIILLAAVK